MRLSPILPHDSQRGESAAVSTIDAVVERIIDVESGGDPNAKNKRSTATGLGQFLDETWLDMIRAWLMLLRLCTLPVASVASNLTRMIALS